MNDQAIKCFQRTYEEVDIPVDVIATDPASRGRFARCLAAALGEVSVDADWALGELTRLRKRGHLPRLRRCT
jgi:hypothetical protein